MYTSRIIHYFSIGLLTLPDGATLRSYLAEKLNCDPMRITKKFAGASCLGRRVFDFRGRSPPSVAEIQFAKTELDLLEQRFRLRVEEGRTGLPLRPPELLLGALPLPTTNSSNQLATAAAIQTWLTSLATQSAPSTAPIGAPQLSSFTLQPANQTALPQNWLLPLNSQPQAPVDHGTMQ